MDGTPEELTTLVGREVYSNNGVFVGEVEDVRLDLDRQAVTGLALGRLNDELFQNRIERGKGVLLPYRWVRAVGDVILVNDVIERLKQPEEETESTLVA
ncbi:PRC-barrel domain-containing protein [Halogeometricum limi]|uniref:Sporulation protein YlmC, PRC-barrel domain family n=1 Tax=Halogeometricum limi TaxID=555875 RepID=A0A1I6ISW1_9EURY|nr:PRC-barrel domain-containing protein [Halogeometricum limi]SFR69320.1 Sporulation protein YlmC, PRC-barrel domain family [Halogeometricum limi]